MSFHNARAFAFEVPGTPERTPASVAPEPDRGHGDPVPDREWGLSAGQVVAAVLAIIAGCELIALIS